MKFRNNSLWPSSWTTSIFSIVLAGLSLAVAAALSFQSPSTLLAASNGDEQEEKSKRKIRIACLGNSIQYYNDCPRLLERMFQEAGFTNMQQESCLRGGASIVTLWERGNGMQQKFGTPKALLNKSKLDGATHCYDIGAPTVKSLLEDPTYDFVIINDHTQSPARESSREATCQLLKEKYAPLLQQSKITPVLLQTAAYKLPNFRGTDDLGDFDHYTKLLQGGYRHYQQLLDEFLQESNIKTLVAPVGLAYSKLYHSNRALWERLYDPDNFHPSPHGTLLQAYVLFRTLTGEAPLTSYDETSWWNRARRMQPPKEDTMPRPTIAEAKILRDVAIQVCQESL